MKVVQDLEIIPPRPNRWRDLAEFISLRVSAQIKAQSGRRLLWVPVFLAIGVSCYFSLRFEPSFVWVLVASALVSGFGLWLLRRMNTPWLSSGFFFLLAMVAGFGLAKLRIERVTAPRLPLERSTFGIDAYIVDNVSNTFDAPRLLVAPLRISGLRPDDTPIRLKLTLKTPILAGDSQFEPGRVIHAFVIAHPPSPASYPGGYDFARQAYFETLGGSGFIVGEPYEI